MSDLKCRKCDKKYPNQEEYFAKSSRHKSGFDTLCKKCKSEIDEEYRKNNKQDISERRKIKYKNEIEPISHDLYVDSILSDQVYWRAKILRRGMQQRSGLDNLDFDVEYFTVDRIQNVITIQKQCPCCKVIFSYGTFLNRTKNPTAPSADRFNSNEGYTRNNVVFICWRCNNLKRDTTIKDLQTVVNWLEKR
jgi:hypothetical protein